MTREFPTVLVYIGLEMTCAKPLGLLWSCWSAGKWASVNSSQRSGRADQQEAHCIIWNKLLVFLTARTTPAQIIKFDAILILRYYPGHRYFGILRYYPGWGYFGILRSYPSHRYFGILRYYPGWGYFGLSFGTAVWPLLEQWRKRCTWLVILHFNFQTFSNCW